MKTGEAVKLKQKIQRKPAAKVRAGTIVFTLMTGYSMVYMDKSMISAAIIPIAENFSLSPAQTGLIMSFFFLGYSLMQIPGGWLADKIGAKKVLLASLAIISLFSYAFGAVSSLMLFVTVRFFAGIGHGGYPPSCSKSIAENFPQERRTFIQSFILSTSGIGGILAFTIGAYLMSLNWRYSYIFLGTVFLAAFILVAVFVPSDAMARSAKLRNSPNFWSLISSRNVIFLFAAMLFLNFLLYGNMSWLPSFLTKKFGLGLPVVGILLAINACFQALTSMTAGVLLSKLFAGKEKAFILGGSVISAIMLLCFMVSHDIVTSVIFLLLLTVVSVAVFTGIFTYPHKIMDSSSIGSAIGIVNTGGTIGGFLAPMILGQLITIAGGNATDSSSFTLSFFVMAAVTLLAGASILGVKVDKPRENHSL